MPKRTNAFQQLIVLIQQQLTDKGTVQESAMLVDRLTEANVEVDIVVDSNVNTIPLRIGIECVAEKRPASVEWVNEMMGKHNSLPVDKTVLVSKSGFSANAKTKAKEASILTLTIEDASDVDWLKFLEDLGETKLGSFEFTPKGGTVTFQQAGPSAVHEGSRIRVPERNVDATFADYILALVQREDVVNSVLRKQWLCTPTDEQNESECTVTFHVEDVTELQCENGEWVEVSSVKVVIGTIVHTTPLKLEGREFNGKQMASGTADNIFPCKQDGSDKVLVNIISVDAKPVKTTVMFPKPGGGEPDCYDLKPAKPEENSDVDAVEE